MLGKKYFKLNYIVTIVLLVLTFSFANNNLTTQNGIEESTAAPTMLTGSF